MYLHQLPSITYAAGGGGTISLKDLPTFLRGRIPHARRIIFDVSVTPTFTTAPTVAGTNNVMTACDFWDGRINRFTGGFNTLRAFERVHNGRVRLPDPDTDTASGTARHFRRSMYIGPPNFVNADSDFVMPCALLANGEIRYTFGALTDLSADTTAATGTVRVYADLELMDEVRIPPAYVFTRYTANSADYSLPGRAVYESLILLRNAAFGNFAAGEIANIRLDLGMGDIITTIPASALTAAYNDDWGCGQFANVQGQPAAASDDNPKIVNPATPTALTATPNDLQVVLWSKPNQKLTKLAIAEASSRIQWDGTLTGGAPILVGRFLPQTAAVVSSQAAIALSQLGRQNRGIKIKTVSKQPYTGPLVEFMPYDITV